MKRVLTQQGPLRFVMDAERLPLLGDTAVCGTEIEVLNMGRETLFLTQLDYRWGGVHDAHTVNALMYVFPPGQFRTLLTTADVHRVGNAGLAAKHLKRGQHEPVLFPVKGALELTLHLRTQYGPISSQQLLLHAFPWRPGADQEPTLLLGYGQALGT